MKKLRLLSLVLACFSIFMLTACSSNSDKNSNDEAYMEPQVTDMATEESADFYAGGGAMNMKSAAPLEEKSQANTPILDNQNQPNLKLIWYADMSVETLNYDELLEGLGKTLSEMGGFVESSSQNGGIDVFGNRNERTSNLTIRIPSAKLDEFLNSVSTLGNVTYQNKRSQNITLEYADNEARLATLKIEYDKLLELLEKAEDLESIITLESRLSDVRYQMDGLSSALRKYDNLVDYSTVQLSIYEVEIMTERPSDSIGSRINLGFKNTFMDIKHASEDFIVFLVVKSPFIIAFALIVLILVKAVKKLTRNKSFTGIRTKLTSKQDLTYPNMEEHSKTDNDQNHDKD